MTTSTPLRILIADDHAIVRRGLTMLVAGQPDMIVVGEAADGQCALDLADATRPDIVIVDVSMPGINGLVATRKLRERQPAVAVVALTRHEEQAYLEGLLRAGASGYVLKHSEPAGLLRAIRVVAAGGIYLDPAMMPRMPDGLLAGAADKTEPHAKVTERELEVLRLVAIGHTNTEIADHLTISTRTVEVHKAHAMRKLGLAGRVDVVRYGVLQGWLYDA